MALAILLSAVRESLYLILTCFLDTSVFTWKFGLLAAWLCPCYVCTDKLPTTKHEYGISSESFQWSLWLDVMAAWHWLNVTKSIGRKGSNWLNGSWHGFRMAHSRANCAENKQQLPAGSL
jgi:hypothetical protein